MDPLSARCKLVTGVLVASIAVNGLSTGVGFWVLHFLDGVVSGAASEDAGDVLDASHGGIGVIQVALALGSIVAFLMWLHRAHQNLTFGRLRHLTYTPGKAVASFFIPFVNFVRPFRVMKEIWSGSAHLAGEEAARSWRENAPSPMIACWWMLGNLVPEANAAGAALSE